MMDTAVVTTDLDRLAERVEKAATLVQELRFKLAQYEKAQEKIEAEKAALEGSMKLLHEQKTSVEGSLAQLQAEYTAAQAANAELTESLKLAASEKSALETGKSRLEADVQTLGTEKADLTRQLQETGAKLQGADPTALVTELAALKKEQRDWTAERKDVATRIEALLKKLDRLDT